jgi:hypothetical protein
VLKLLVRCAGRDEEAFSVSGGEATDYAGAGDCAVADGDDVLEFGFEDGVEVFAGAEGDERVRVGQGGEDADSGST